MLALRSDGLDVLGISQDNLEVTEDFISSYDLDFEVVIDPDGEVKEEYKCGALPQKILIDEEGKIEFVEVGAVPMKEEGELEKRLKRHSGF